MLGREIGSMPMRGARGRNRIDGWIRIETAQAKASRTVKVNDNEEVRIAA